MDETLKRPAASGTAAAFVPASTPLPHRTPAARLAPSARIGARHRLGGRANATMDAIYREMVKFGAVGGLAYLVDLYVYNLMRTGLWPVTDPPLAGKPLLAKVVSVSVATLVAWLGNRYWTFRHRRRNTVQAEFVLFFVMNAGGLLIALGCLWVSHYVLGQTSALADNISGNVIGLGLGTLFRFWAYRQFVFTDRPQRTSTAEAG
jgi:putative flippase GtrA